MCGKKLHRVTRQWKCVMDADCQKNAFQLVLYNAHSFN